VAISQSGFGITASASKGKGHANSDEVSYSNTHVSAGNVVTIDSGGDANLRGTVVSGKQVVADVGGDLNLQSLQDSSSFDGKQQNIGGSVTIGRASPPVSATATARPRATTPASPSRPAYRLATAAFRSTSLATPTSRGR
jgi:hypothetical protein